MENGPFINGLPINSMVIFHGYVSHNQRVRAILSCKEKRVPSCSLHGERWLPPVVGDLGLKMAEDPTESFPLTGNSLCNDQHGSIWHQPQMLGYLQRQHMGFLWISRWKREVLEYLLRSNGFGCPSPFCRGLKPQKRLGRSF